MKGLVKICIVGDVMPVDTPLFCGQGAYSSCKGDFSQAFAFFEDYSKKFDFAIGNFEAVLVERIESTSPADSAMKTSRPILSILRQSKFMYMSIANNHTMEYGPDSFHWMCNTLKEANILPFGQKQQPYITITPPGTKLKICLFAFSTVPAMYGYNPEYYFVDKNSTDELSSLISLLREARRKCDHLLVFPHWGNEFMTRPAQWQIELARKMVDCGVSAIFGAHSHTIQSACMIGQAPVYFSLGNLLSDYFQERFKRNAVVSVEIGDALEVTAEIFSCSEDYLIIPTGEKLNLETGLETEISADCYQLAVNMERHIARRELLFRLIQHPSRWIFRWSMWRWLLIRAFFLMRNAKRIQKDPDNVYSGTAQ